MKALVCRELLRSRRVVIYSLVGALSASLLFILVALSFRVGNLTLLPDDIREGFFDLNNSVSLPLMAFLSGMPMLSAASADSESDRLWRMFRKSTPVTPLKFSGAKYIMLGCRFLLSLVCAFLLSWLFCLAADIPFSLETAATALGYVEAVLVLSVVFQVMQSFLRASGDIVGLIMVGIIVMPISIIGVYSTENEIDLGISADKIAEQCVTLFPFTLLILAVIFGVGLLLTAAAYKRREK